MTSFTRKLYQRDPAAAEAFHKAQTFESRHTYGRHPTLLSFTMAEHEKVLRLSAKPQQPSFGKRQSPPSATHACTHSCGHVACKHGCVLFRQH